MAKPVVKLNDSSKIDICLVKDFIKWQNNDLRFLYCNKHEHEDILMSVFIKAKIKLLKVALKCYYKTRDERLYYEALTIIESIMSNGVLTSKKQALAKLKFTQQERCILYLFDKHLNTKQIVKYLSISEATLRTHIKNISDKIKTSNIGERYKKTLNDNVKNPIEVINNYLEFGWIPNDDYKKYYKIYQ